MHIARSAALLAALLSSFAFAQDTVKDALNAPTDEPARWPGSPKFGIRAGIGGGTATAGIEAGNVGVKILLTDTIGLSIAFGLGVSASNNFSTATVALDGQVNFYLRDTSRSLRPYIPVLLGFGVDSSRNNNGGEPPTGNGVFQMALGAGFGAEYWFSKQFSLAADLMLRLVLANFDPFLVRFGTITPGVHATYYF